MAKKLKQKILSTANKILRTTLHYGHIGPWLGLDLVNI